MDLIEVLLQILRLLLELQIVLRDRSLQDLVGIFDLLKLQF